MVRQRVGLLEQGSRPHLGYEELQQVISRYFIQCEAVLSGWPRFLSVSDRGWVIADEEVARGDVIQIYILRVSGYILRLSGVLNFANFVVWLLRKS